MNTNTIYCFVIISLVILLGQFSTCSSVVLRHHVSDGNVHIELNVNVNLNGQPIKKEHIQHENVKKQNKQVKTIVSQVSNTISADEEEKISEQLLINGNEFRQIAKLIPGKSPEETKLKDQFLALAGELSKESKKPSSLILESSYAMVQQDLDAQIKKQLSVKSTETSGISVFNKDDKEPLLQGSLSPRSQGTKTLILPLVIGGIAVVSGVTDVVDGIGSYSSTLGSVSKWISDSAAKKLDVLGMNTLANVARSTGRSMGELSNKIAPYEKELAEKIKPVVTDPIYRAGKTGVDIVTTVASVAGATKELAKNSVKLPGSFKRIQSSLSNIAQKVENPKQLVTGITGAAVSGFNRLTGNSGALSKSVLEREIRRNANLIGTTGLRLNNVANSANDIKEGVEKLTGTAKEETLEEKLKEKLQPGNLANSFFENRFRRSTNRNQTSNRNQPNGNRRNKPKPSSGKGQNRTSQPRNGGRSNNRNQRNNRRNQRNNGGRNNSGRNNQRNNRRNQRNNGGNRSNRNRNRNRNGRNRK